MVTYLSERVSMLWRRIPLTIVLLVIIFIVGMWTGTVARDTWPSLMQRFGWNLPALQQGRFYAPWVGLLFASLPGEHYTMLGMLALGVGTLEYQSGTKVAAAGFLLLGPFSSILTMLVLWPLDILRVVWVRQYLYPPDMGSSAASMVCWGLFLTAATGKWRLLFMTGTFLVLLALLFLPQVYGADHMIAFILGVGVGTVAHRVTFK